MSFKNCYCDCSPCRCRKKKYREDSCSYDSSSSYCSSSSYYDSSSSYDSSCSFDSSSSSYDSSSHRESPSSSSNSSSNSFESSSSNSSSNSFESSSSSSSESSPSGSSNHSENSSSYSGGNREDRMQTNMAFGSFYNPAANPLVPAVAPAALSNSITQGTIVNYPQVGPFLGTIPNPGSNSLTVLSSGIYDLSFSLTVSLFTTALPAEGTPDLISSSIYVNDILDPISTVTISSDTVGNTISTLTKSIHRFLNKGDVVTVRCSAVSLTANTSTAAYGGSSLVVKEILKTRSLPALNSLSLDDGLITGKGFTGTPTGLNIGE